MKGAIIMICKYCNYPLEEYVVHDGSRDEPATIRYECECCGPVDGYESQVDNN